MAKPHPEVDLANCDREPIHVPGAIQDFGGLVAVSPDWAVRHVSANAARFFGAAPDEMLGLPLDRFLEADALHDIRGRLQMIAGPDQVERLFALRLTGEGPPHDVSLHFSDDSIVLEAEPSGEDRAFDAVAAVKGMMARLTRLGTESDYFEHAARQLRAMLGFGRVMVYRFDHDGAGEVIAESAQHGLPSLKGLRYPASDIPRQARELYRRNWLRLIADVSQPAVPVLPALSPEGEPLDLSLCGLRAVSPIHIEYLRNMGVAASLSISVMRGDQLWGLFACHHATPRPLSFQRRTAAELFGHLFSLQLESREQRASREYEVAARQAQERIMAALSAGDSLFDGLSRLAPQLRGLIPCDGVAICADERIATSGATPTREELLGLARFLNRAAASRVYATSELGRHHPPAADYPERAAGVIAVPVSRTPRDYVLFFRQELPRHVTWAGDPSKPATLGPNGLRLTPRKSFEAWREMVHGQSAPWTEAERQVAESLRVTLLETIVRLSGAAEEQRRALSARQDLLIAELNHRVRNILGLIRALVARSRESAESLENFVQVLSDRIFALAQAHDLLTADQWRPIALRTLLTRELDAYLGNQKARVRLDGPPVLVAAQAFTVLALVFHELTTNAAKYGGICDRHGNVSVAWSLDGTGSLVVEWRESGGPAVQPPRRQGFGTTIIERSIPFELEGTADVRYEVTGLVARFTVPARYVERAAADAGAEAGREEPATPRGAFSGTALVLEDNAVIAFDAEHMLRRLGFSRAETAGNVQHALDLLDRMPAPGFALLDVNLGSGTSIPVARELKRRGIPFLFASGYGEQLTLPPDLAGSPIISKPYREETVARMAAEAIARTRPD